MTLTREQLINQTRSSADPVRQSCGRRPVNLVDVWTLRLPYAPQGVPELILRKEGSWDTWSWLLSHLFRQPLACLFVITDYSSSLRCTDPQCTMYLQCKLCNFTSKGLNLACEISVTSLGQESGWLIIGIRIAKQKNKLYIRGIQTHTQIYWTKHLRYKKKSDNEKNNIYLFIKYVLHQANLKLDRNPTK